MRKFWNTWNYHMHRTSQVALVVKNLPANVGDIIDVGSIPGSRGFPGGGHGNPFQYFMDKGAWQATQCIGSQRVRQEWSDLDNTAAHHMYTIDWKVIWDAVPLPFSLGMCLQKKCFVFIQTPRTIKFSDFISYKLVNMSLPKMIIPNYLKLLKVFLRVFFFFYTKPEIALWNPLPLNQSWHFYSKWLLGIWEGLQKTVASLFSGSTFSLICIYIQKD